MKMKVKKILAKIRWQTWVALVLIVIVLPVIAIALYSPQETQAEWYDESYGIRQRFSFTHNADISDRRAITFTLDTSEIITDGVMQSDCDDTRFTDINGDELLYDLTGTCNNASTTYEVIFEEIVNGDNVGYVYYNNPSAINAEIDSTQFTALTPSGGDPSAITDRTNEEQSPGPIAYWKFDEGVDNTCVGGTNDACDSGSGANDGAFGGVPSWLTDDKCITGKCLNFDGTDDTITVSSTVYEIQSVSFWIRLFSASTTQEILDLNATDYFTSVNGTLTVNNFGTDTIYIDAVSGATTLTANKWHHITITTTTAFDGSAIAFAEVGGAYGNIALDEVKIYNYERTAAQIKQDFNQGAGAVLGASDQKFLSDGLVGYWPMEDNVSGNGQTITDDSGNGNDGTTDDGTNNTGMDCTIAGEFGYGCDFDNIDDSISVAADSSHENIFDGGGAVSGWINVASDGEGSSGRIIDKSDWKVWVNSESAGAVKISFQQDHSSNHGNWNSVSTEITLNELTHFAVTYSNDDNNNDPVFYINGEIVAITELVTPDGTRNTDSGNVLYIGNNGTGGTRTFDGSIDDARIYNRALSPAEIRQLYNWAPGPITYWNLDENTGTTAYDKSGNSNNGTLTNTPEYTQGKFGSGVSFSGSNQHITRVDDPDLDFGSGVAFTLSTWFKHDIASATETIVSKLESSGTDGGYRLKMESDGDITCETDDDDADTAIDDTATTTAATYDDNKWHHVACVYDTENTDMLIYIDGVLVASDTTITTNTLANDDDFFFGIEAATGTEDWIGELDDLRVYNYARTPGQIIEDMNAGHPLGGSPVGSQAAYWKFDENYGTTANNQISSNSSIIGSISGATWTSHTSSNCKFGSCLDYDGTNDVTTITNADAIDFDVGLSGGFSISTWFNADSDGENNTGEIWQKGTNTYCRTDSESGGVVDIECSLDLATTDANVNVSSAVAINSWHHLMLVYDDASTITVYIDGSERGSDTGSGDLSADANNLLIGGSTSANFDGSIDEFKIYAAELNSGQVKADMNSGSTVHFGGGNDEKALLAGSAGNPPVGYWDFNEKTGTTTNDKGSGQNNGTLTNMDNDDWVVGKYGSALDFDGSNDFVDVGAGPATVRSITLWVKPDTTTEHIIDLNGSDYLSVSSGTLGYTGDGSETIYVDGVASTTLAANTWQHVAVVLSANDNASDLDIGRLESTDNYAGQVDDVRLWDYALTTAQIAYEYNRGGPIAWWRFDECQSTTVNDSAGDNTTGTINEGGSGDNNGGVGSCNSGDGAEMWDNGTTGKFQSSLDFDGTDDYIGMGDVSSFNFQPTDPFSVTAWINLDAFPTNTNFIHKRNSSTHDGWALHAESSRVGFILGDAGATKIYVFTAANTLSTSTWHHVALAYSGNSAASGVTIYVDGQVRSLTAADDDTGATITYSHNMEVGRHYTAVSYINGQIDDVRVYNYTLSADQVKQVFNNGSVSFR